MWNQIMTVRELDLVELHKCTEVMLKAVNLILA